MSESAWRPVVSPDIAAAMSQQQIIDAATSGETLNERAVLEALTQLVLTESVVHPDFQVLANTVIAKAFLVGTLPAGKAKNRPKGTGRFAVGASGLSAEDVAVEFFDAMDSCEDLGEPASKTEVVAWLAELHGADEKTIRIAIKEALAWLPDSKDGRDQLRRDADFLGLPWDFRNRRFAAQTRASANETESISGRSLSDAGLLVAELREKAVSRIKGGKSAKFLPW